jgi:trigger factor
MKKLVNWLTMQVTRDNTSDIAVTLTITAEQSEIDIVKEQVLRQLGASLRVQGFRQGKAPLHLLEKHVDQATLQTAFLERIVNDLYMNAIRSEKLRITKAPEIAITKFVPFTTLQFNAVVEVISAIELADYKKIRLPRTKVKVTAKQIDDVIADLRKRAAEKKEVKRAAQDGDQVVLDFAGVDAKTQEPIDGADGKAYPLLLGSKTFIPGFEEELVGLKPGDTKTFPITFPKDYGVATLQNRNVTFTVTVHTVQKLVEPKLDDAFAASVGPFKTLIELRADIKRQLEVEAEQQARSDYNNTLLEKIAAETKVTIPDSLIDSEIDRIEEEERRNLVYRGQTWHEHLAAEGVTAEQHRERNRAGAELRVKAGIILTEVSEQEGIVVTPEELEIQIQLLKGRYTDEAMIAELDKPEGRRDIASRLLSEKTIDKLAEYATAK